MELKDIPHKVFYRNIKYPRLEFGSGKLHFILPLDKKPEAIYRKHKKWIIKKIEFIEECLNEASNVNLIERTYKEFKELIYYLAAEAANEMKLEINKVTLRMMKTKWASSSSKRNLTINKLMKYLPEHLIKYIIYHEITHFKQKKHNDEFWKIISKKFHDYKKLERDLFIYWFKLAGEGLFPGMLLS